MVLIFDYAPKQVLEHKEAEAANISRIHELFVYFLALGRQPEPGPQ
jgi:hypothetical protein